MPTFEITTPRGDTFEVGAPDGASPLQAVNVVRNVAALADAIEGRESGGNRNAVSPQGASGELQIMPGTFKDYAVPGQDDYENKAHLRAAALRKLTDDFMHYGGDMAKTAAAYIGGRGAVRDDGSLRDDVHDALGTSPSAYAQQVLARLKLPAPLEDAPAAPAGPSGGPDRVNPPAAPGIVSAAREQPQTTDPMGGGDFSSIVNAQPAYRSVLQDAVLPEPKLSDEQLAERDRLSNRAYAERTPDINDPRNFAPSMTETPQATPAPAPAPSSGSLAKDLAINAFAGGAKTLTGAGATLAEAAGANDTAQSLDQIRKNWEGVAKENGGETIAGRAADLVGSVAPAFLLPAAKAAQLVSAAGLFAIPAFRDTLKSQLDQGRPFPLALAHAAESFGINLFLPQLAMRGSGAIAQAMGAEGKGIIGAATAGAQAAGEGAAFSAANSVVDKATDLAAGQQNDRDWLDLKDMAASALGFTALRGAHMAPQAIDAVRDRVGTRGQLLGRALEKDIADTKLGVPSDVQLNPNLQRDPVADIMSAPTVEAAAAAAERAAAAPAGPSAADEIRAIRPNQPSLPEDAASILEKHWGVPPEARKPEEEKPQPAPSEQLPDIGDVRPGQDRNADLAPPQTAESLRDKLRARWGDVTDRLERAGALKVWDNVDQYNQQAAPGDQLPSVARGTVQGFHDEHGVAHLFANNIDPGHETGVLLHEVGEHASMKDMLGQQRYSDLIRQAYDLVRDGDPIARAAFERIPADTPDQHRPSEMLAYLIEEGAKAREGMTPGLRQWMLDAMSSLRAWFYQTPFARSLQQRGIRMNLRPEDIVALADRAVRWRADEGEAEPGGPQYSVRPTGRKERVGDFDVYMQRDGSITVKGNAEAIRSLIPEGQVGRAVDGGLAFSTSAAPRVRAALEGSRIAYGRKGEVLKDLPMRDGKYVGAPEKFNTPGKIGGLRRALRQLAQEGERGRFWYENSSRAIMHFVGGDIPEGKRLTALLAIYSPQAKVDANSTFALRAWAQYKMGQPISVKTAVQDAKAEAAMRDVDAFWSGEKTGNFYTNLLSEIDPATRGQQGATIDMWMMRAGRYSNDAPTATQYAFMENETNRLAKEMGWEPQQVQAAIWVAMKARMENEGVKKNVEALSEKKGWLRFERGVDEEGKATKKRVILDEQKHRDNWIDHAMAHDVTAEDTEHAKFDFADGIRRHIGQVSWEPRPGRATGILPGIHDAPYDQQLEFQQAIQRQLYDEQGGDMLAKRLGLLTEGTTPGPGVWQGEVSAGAQQRIAMAPAKGKEGVGQIDAAQKAMLDAYAASLGLLLRQDSVGYHRPFYATNKAEQNGVELRVGRPFTQDEAQQLWTAMDQRMRAAGVNDWDSGAGLITSPAGMRLVNDGALRDNRAFRDMVTDAVRDLPIDAHLFEFASDGALLANDWKENPHGQGFEQAIRAAGRPDVYGWARDVLAPRVQAVFEDFSQRYGWGDPGQVGDAFGAAGDGGGRYSRRSLAPLEGAPDVAGATGPDPRLVDVADRYAREHGIRLERQSRYADVDEGRARRLAAAYDSMEHAPQDPKVREAYENLIAQTEQQYRALERAGYKFYLFDENSDPYQGNPWNAMRDLRANKRMGVFATEAGFGSGATELNTADNPLLADTGIRWPYGSPDGPLKRVLANDLFRAVHDAFGHGLEGAGFRARGEENAWQAHARLFTGSALAALTSETRGQNSWLNYGPHGESNRSAKIEDTVFADQKTGLMPEWTWNEGKVEGEGNPDIRFSERRREQPFYSGLARGIEGIGAKAQGGDGWRAAVDGLINKGLVKRDEVEWSGLNEWLRAQDGKVTKQAVLDYLAHNGVQVQEVAKGSALDAADQINRHLEPMGFHAESDTAVGDELMYIDDRTGDLVDFSELPPQAQDVIERASQGENGAITGPTKYGSYTLPGGQNYRELLLTLPVRSNERAIGRSEAEHLANDESRFVYMRYRADDGEMETERVFPSDFDGGLATNAEFFEMPGGIDAQANGAFHSSHWDEPNILAHIRLNDRVDSEGRRVLFVEELQSDWAQKGRRQGFYDPERPYQVFDPRTGDVIAEYAREQNAHEHAMSSDRGAQNYLDYIDARKERGGKAPMAPFVDKTDAWLSLALKRIIKMAADEGYDRVAFVNGQQSADRYDLSKQVSELRYDPRTRNLVGTPVKGNRPFTKTVTPEELPDLVGKEVAKRLLEAPPGAGFPHQLSGLDMKVGGEGMHGFYDGIVPTTLKKLLPKFGSSTREVVIDVGGNSARVGDPDGAWPFEVIRHGRIINRYGNREGAEEELREFRERDARNGETDPTLAVKQVLDTATKHVGFDVSPEMRQRTKDGVPMFSRRGTTAATAGMPTTPPTSTWQRSKAILSDLIDEGLTRSGVYRLTAPMSEGSARARAIAQQFANSTRLSRSEWQRISTILEKRFTPAQRQKMWEAADEQNTLLQQGRPTAGSGLDRLTPEERDVVEQLHTYGEELLRRAKNAGMFKGEGLPYWTPRMMVMIDASGEFVKPTEPGKKQTSGGDGRNVFTTSSNLKERKYLTAAETEAAMQAKGGELVRDIMTMPLAMDRLERAIAGRELINQIKDLGRATGNATVATGRPSHEGWFTLDHSAFTTFTPRFVEDPGTGRMRPLEDENGDLVFDRVPLYMSKEFEGPIKAILSNGATDHALYRAYMLLKSKAMSAIMFSPLIHNLVILGRAMGYDPTLVGTLALYVRGHSARKDNALMREAIQGGMVPMGYGRQGMNDITDIARGFGKEGGWLDPHESWIAHGARAILGSVHKPTGEAAKRFVDRAGDIWHGTLLWDRVADLQMGIFQRSYEKLVAKGYEPAVARTVAAHWANRYAGAVANENMSAWARIAANVMLFSRSFNMGNLGTIKDMGYALPAGLRGIIETHHGDVANDVFAMARRKAIGGFIADAAMALVATALTQSIIDHWKKDKSGEEIWGGYVDRAQRMGQKIKEHPLNPTSYSPFQLTPGHDHEPGKEDRVDMGEIADQGGRHEYMRLPTGKVVEDLINWTTHFPRTFDSKMSPLAKAAWQLLSNDRGFGVPVYDPNGSAAQAALEMAKHLAKSQTPWDTIVTGWDKLHGKTTEVENDKLVGNMTGFTFSQGHPGGPEAGVAQDVEDRIKAQKMMAMEQVKRLLRYDNEDQARAKLEDIGLTPKEVNSIIKHLENPSEGMSRSQQKKFNQHGTEEDQQRMDRLNR